MNSVQLIGRLTKNPELKQTGNNKAYLPFTLAVNRGVKDANGQMATDFIMCKVFGKSAENMARFCAKGSLVGVSARVQTGSYKDKNGNTVYTTDFMVNNVEFLSPKSNNQNNNGNNNYGFNGNNNQNYNNANNNNMNNSGYGANPNFNSGYDDFMASFDVYNNPFTE